MAFSSFGELLKHELYFRGITEYDFAKKINVSQTTISKWIIRGGYPQSHILDKIQKELDCELKLSFGNNRLPYKETSGNFTVTFHPPKSVFKLNSSALCNDFFRMDFPDINYKESIYIACLNGSTEVIGKNLLSTSGGHFSDIDVRILLHSALLSGSKRIIICHNHPSNAEQPSDHDILLTRKIFKACDIVGIELTDHIIICPNGKYFSFRDEGIL